MRLNILSQETIKRVDNKEMREKVSELIRKNFKFTCVSCNATYKELPTKIHEDGHRGREVQRCKCGSDLLIPIYRLLENCYSIYAKPIIINGKATHIVKEHNFKFCNCIVDNRPQKIHYGDTEKECGAKFGDYLEEIDRDNEYVTFHCKKSDYYIKVLRDNEDEKKIRQNEYFITPIKEG